MKTSKNYESSKKYLIKLFRINRNVYTGLDHVSSSGMTRHISCYVARRNEIINITWHISNVLGYRIAKRKGLVVGGCGMDMGFSVVYDLSRTLYPKGFKLPKGEYGRNNDTSGYDKDGGYRMKQSWI